VILGRASINLHSWPPPATGRPHCRLSTGSHASNIQPEDVELWLPSNLPPGRQCATCIEGLLEMENKLWMAQCYDGLEGVQHLLQVKARMVYFKNKNVQGQRDGTRSQVVIDHVHTCMCLAADKYRAV
jgi:hypothetical protein